jgi:hypothetical protein
MFSLSYVAYDFSHFPVFGCHSSWLIGCRRNYQRLRSYWHVLKSVSVSGKKKSHVQESSQQILQMCYEPVERETVHNKLVANSNSLINMKYGRVSSVRGGSNGSLGSNYTSRDTCT